MIIAIKKIPGATMILQKEWPCEKRTVKETLEQLTSET
jgi:hypothetical protein